MECSACGSSSDTICTNPDTCDDGVCEPNHESSSTLCRADAGACDVAELCDGFLFITLAWLEALGFCGKGEGGSFLEGGRNIARDGGVVPLNTHGGQLSAGRLHCYGFLHEACVQLWGEAGARQLGTRPEVAVAGAGGGTLAGVLLLTK